MEQAPQTNLCSSWLCCTNSSVKFYRLSYVTSLPTKTFSSTCINVFYTYFLSLLLTFVKDELHGMYQRSKPLFPSDCTMKLDSASSYPAADSSHVYCMHLGILSHRRKLVAMHIAQSRFFIVINGILRKKLNVIFKAKSNVPVDMLSLCDASHLNYT